MKEIYDIKQSVGLKCVLKQDGAPLTLGYSTADIILNNAALGEVVVTIIDLTTGLVASDTNGTSWDSIHCYANGTVYSEAVITVSYGFPAGNYSAVFWLKKTSSGILSYREVEKKRFEVKSISPQVTPP